MSEERTKRKKKQQAPLSVEDACLTLHDLRAQRDLLLCRSAQTTRRLDATYGRLIGTPQRPNPPATTPNDAWPPGSPQAKSMNALLDALHIEYEGSRELADISREIVKKACDLAVLQPGTERHEATQVELDALLSARSAMWQEQSKMIDLIEPMLAKHGFPLQAAAPAPAPAPPAAATG